MNTSDSLSKYGLVPPGDALPLIREMLTFQSSCHDDEREEDLALLCCVQLFSHGLLPDTLNIWKAKRGSMDLASVIDVQLLCGAGVDETVRFLRASTDPLAPAALSYILECVDSGDFEGFSPSGHLDFYRSYFGNAEP